MYTHNAIKPIYVVIMTVMTKHSNSVTLGDFNSFDFCWDAVYYTALSLPRRLTSKSNSLIFFVPIQQLLIAEKPCSRTAFCEANQSFVLPKRRERHIRLRGGLNILNPLNSNLHIINTTNQFTMTNISFSCFTVKSTIVKAI